MAKDYLGNEIKVGDEVIYLSFCRTSSNFRRGTVSGVTEKCAYIDATRKEGHKIISLTSLERRAEIAETAIAEIQSARDHTRPACVVDDILRAYYKEREE